MLVHKQSTPRLHMSQSTILSTTCRNKFRHFLLAAAVAAPIFPAYAAITTTTYNPSDAAIPNPERGFYRHAFRYHCNEADYSDEKLREIFDEGTRLVMCYFILNKETDEVSLADRQRLQRQAALVKAHGLKMILRFAYTESDAGVDATPDRVQKHLDQLASFIRSNADVIAVVQMGFVGAFGEGFYTEHFGNMGILTETNQHDRKYIVDKLLEILPATRSVQVRTPWMKSYMYAPLPNPPAATRKSGNTGVGRVGHHNDCFVRSGGDRGTFTDILDNNGVVIWTRAEQRAYVAKDSYYVPVGGETCWGIEDVDPYPEYAKCSSEISDPAYATLHATAQMAAYHYSYLNLDYSTAVLQHWKDFGCYNEIEKRLGYRFRLISVTASDTVYLSAGRKLAFEAKLHNDGWARPFNSYNARLILRNTLNGAKYAVSLGDTKDWLPGYTISVPPLPLRDSAYEVTLPSSIPVGTYELLIKIEDPAIPNNAAYTIQLANIGTWEGKEGMNRLNRKVVVRP